MHSKSHKLPKLTNVNNVSKYYIMYKVLWYSFTLNYEI